jgi:hypothetical protein
MQSKASTADAYLKELPEDRREAISTLRKTILEHLPVGYEETMLYGMITYIVPLALYLTNVYSDPDLSEWFVKEYEKSGKKLDMGKSCVRFSKLEQVPLGVIGEAVAKTSVDDFIALYVQRKKK